MRVKQARLGEVQNRYNIIRNLIERNKVEKKESSLIKFPFIGTRLGQWNEVSNWLI